MENFDKIVLEPLATPYLAFIPVTEEEVKAKMDEYWEENKDNLIKAAHYKGKKGEHGSVDYGKARKRIEDQRGLEALYGYTFALMGQDKIEAELGRTVMLVNSAVYNTSRTPLLFLNMYFYPVIHYEPDQFSLEVRAFESFTFDEEYEGRLRDLKYRHKVRKDVKVVTESSEVVIEVQTLKNGETYLPETLKNYRKDVKDIELPEVKGTIIGKEVGSCYEIDELRGEDNFKQIVQVIQVYDIQLLNDDDPALFAGEGIANIEEFKEKVKVDYDRVHDYQLREYVYRELINRILTEGTLEPVPQRFVDLAVENIAKRHGSSDNNQVKQQIADQVLRDVVQEMAKNWYKKTFNLPKTMSFTELTDDMLNRVSWF